MTQGEIVILVSWLCALVIGIVVSFDVSGLLISRHRDFQQGESQFTRVAFGNATLHAATHALLFLGYFYIVSIPISWFDWLLQVLSQLRALFPPINAKEVGQTVFLLSSLIIVIFVWITYSQKIIENHGAKLEKNENPLVHARIDIRVLYWFARKWTRNARWLVNFALALAVAVDMLAITSFIRVFFSVSPDADNPGGDTASGTSSETLPHFDFGFGAPALEPLLFAFIIFVTVFCTAMVAIWGSRNLGNGARTLFWLRVLEPLFVFWFMVASIDHMFGLPSVNPAQYGTKVLLGLPVAVILTALLVSVHGRKAIEDAVEGGMSLTLKDEALLDASVTVDKGLSRALAIFFASLIILVAVLIILFFITHPPTIAAGQGLGKFLSAAANLATGITLIALYAPLPWIVAAEQRMDRHIFGSEAGGGGWPLIASFAAYFVILVYIHMSYVGSDLFSLHGEERFIIPLFYFGCIGLATCLLALLRAKRHLIAAQGGRGISPSVGEFLSAFAIAIFLFQIFHSIGW